MSAITLRKSTLHPLFDFLHVLHHQKSVSVQKYPYCIVLYCLSNKYFKVIFSALNSELLLIAANKFLNRSSVLDVTDLDSIEEHIYTVIVSFMYLLIIELLYGKISAGRLLWMSEHY